MPPGSLGLETPPPDEATSAKLKALAIEGATLDRNPIDVTLAGVKSDTLPHHSRLGHRKSEL